MAIMSVGKYSEDSTDELSRTLFMHVYMLTIPIGESNHRGARFAMFLTFVLIHETRTAQQTGNGLRHNNYQKVLHCQVVVGQVN